LEVRESLLEILNGTLEQLCDHYSAMENPGVDIYEGWTAKDVLGHLTFWHESFARILGALVIGKKPYTLKGKYTELNQRCFDEMRPLTTEQIITRLEAAHHVVQKNILSENLYMIPYKMGSRDYTPEEHLDIVNNHIRSHLKDLEDIKINP